jgi:hypothetical protein
MGSGGRIGIATLGAIKRGCDDAEEIPKMQGAILSHCLSID